MMKNRPRFDENIEKLFGVIKEAKSQGVPDWRVNKMYEVLCENILKHTITRDKEQREIDHFDQHNDS